MKLTKINIIKSIIYYSGFEYIFRKIKPAKKPRPLPTFILWLIAVYIASFGVASQRYENRVDIIENKANSIYPQLASGDPVTKEMAFRRILRIQEMECPYKPDIKHITTVIRSFWDTHKYEGVTNLLRETVENWKGDLYSINLSDIDLNGFDLEEANLDDANLAGTNLAGANLRHARLRSANLTGANLEGADLTGAILSIANIREANLEKTNLRNAILESVMYTSVEQFSKVRTLYDTKLSSALKISIEEKYPHLLEEPKDDDFINDTGAE